MKNSGAGLIAYWIEKRINEVEERFEEIGMYCREIKERKYQ